jgi:hypothetical protein
MTVSNYSTTAINNTSINGVNISEGMSPSDVNNSIREQLKDVRSVWNDKEWFLLGDGDGTTTFTRASATSITVASDITSSYHVGRRIKIVGSNTGTIFGKIATSAYSSPNTTVTFTFDSGTINASDSTVSVYVGSSYTNPGVSVVDEDAMGSDSAVLPPSQQSVKAFVTSGTVTMTNKTLTSPTLTSPVLNTSLSGTAFKDEDDMSSDSATAVASQQSIKAYVDTQLTGEDLDFAGDSGTGAVDLDSQTFTLAGGEGIDTTASGQTLTIAGEDATTSNKGIASFHSDNFAVSSGAVTIKDGGVANAELANSSITVTDGSSSTATSLGGTITFSAGEGLDVAESSGTITYSGEDATVSNKGIASFDTNNFSVSSGAVSIKTAGVGNTQVATGIDATKIADGSVTNSEFQYIGGLTSDAQTQLTGKLTASNNLSDVSSASTSRTNLGLGTISTQASNNVSITGGSITGMSTPSSNSDVAIKSYVDEAVAGLRTRIIAECASTANVNISNGLEAGDSIDGVTLVAGDRVLLKDQSTATENGLYLAVSSGSASRDPEYDTIAELSGGLIVVNQGSTNDNKIFLCTTDSDGSIGSTNITYTQVTPSNTGTVTSIGLAQSGSEFTISNSPVTSAGNITLDVNRISATKIGANTNISDTEYGYLNGVSSNIQTQLDNSASLGDAISFAVALGS